MVALLALQTVQRSVGYIVLAVVVVGGIFFVITQVRGGRKELGSEIELAANRKPYFTDEELETKKLNWALWSAFGLLVVVALSLPLYWIAEPGRQAGAVKDFRTTFEEHGLDVYENQAKCVGCHGPKGVGGQASFVITDEKGNYVKTVAWNAPALNTVLWRFSVSEVTDILVYGRPGSPMQPWGVKGGGALSDQQISNTIAYLWSVQLSIPEMRKEVMDDIKAADAGLADRLDAVQKKNAAAMAKDPSSYECTDGKFACLSDADQLYLGEILFNNTGNQSGAYSCARCHIAGASFGMPGKDIGTIARGRYGPNLAGVEKDMTITQHFNLVMNGTEAGKIYGANHQGDGRMPGFGLNANNGDTTAPQLGAAGMLTPEQVWAIITYERSLDKEQAAQAASSASAATPVAATQTASK